MLSRFIALAALVALAAASPTLESRTNPPSGYHYNIGSIAVRLESIRVRSGFTSVDYMGLDLVDSLPWYRPPR